MIFIKQILIESRIDDFKRLLRDKFTSSFLQFIVDRDLSKNHKNLLWIGKILKSEPDTNVEEMLNNLNLFNRIGTSTDLYQFKDYLSFVEFLNKKSKEVQMGKMAQVKRNTSVIADTKRWQVVAPKRHESCQYYGGGTNWCISTSNERHWNNHFYEGTIVIIKDRSKQPDDLLFKVAAVGNAAAVFDNHSYSDSESKKNLLAQYVYFWRKDDTRMSKNDTYIYLSSIPEEIVDKIINYFEDDDVNERQYERYYELASKKFTDGNGRDILVKELFYIFTTIVSKTMEIDDEVDADDYDKIMRSLFEKEEWNWDDFLSQLWHGCISEQGVDDDDFSPDIGTTNIKRRIDDHTEYSYEDIFQTSAEALKSSESFTVMDDIIRRYLRGNIMDPYDERFDKYYALKRHMKALFPNLEYNGILIQSLQMYNKKKHPGFFQGQMSFPYSGLAGTVNTFVPKTIDDVINVLSINPKATDIVKWIQTYRKDLKEYKRIMLKSLLFKYRRN